jgi:threonine aldolase
MVWPAMVYVSQPTEYGTLYTKQELEAIREVCRSYGLPLYVDGARLAAALAVDENDLTLPELAKLCDVFYLGGTKAGALCGEAVVFSGMPAPKHFFSTVKQHGALLAKGRLVGVQFEALFTDDLYVRIGRHAVRMADRLRRAFAERGYEFAPPTTANQLFVVLERDVASRLAESVAFEIWEPLEDGRVVARFVTSWATTPESINALIALL